MARAMAPLSALGVVRRAVLRPGRTQLHGRSEVVAASDRRRRQRGRHGRYVAASPQHLRTAGARDPAAAAAGDVGPWILRARISRPAGRVLGAGERDLPGGSGSRPRRAPAEPRRPRAGAENPRRADRAHVRTRRSARAAGQVLPLRAQPRPWNVAAAQRHQAAVRPARPIEPRQPRI
jgi:hypothetical protein